MAYNDSHDNLFFFFTFHRIHSLFMIRLIIIVFSLIYTAEGFAQTEHWFYLRAKDSLFNPDIKRVGEYLVYEGEDKGLERVFNEHRISTFKKTFRGSTKDQLKRTFFVISDNDDTGDAFLRWASDMFEFAEKISEADKKIFQPNDYGITSTTGENLGLPLNLDYLDFLEAPRAWYYTTGNRETIVGISDAEVDTINAEFKGKVKIIRKSPNVKGHGSGVAGIAAAQGDNAYGGTGICYDCGIYATSYGSYKTLDQLKELSDMGVKVINCSWVSSKYYDTAQAVINEMFENGTIVVAGAGNRPFSENKGEWLYYPASYDNVISVGTAMYKYTTPQDNYGVDKKGNYYASNIRGFIGRTMGFKNNDLSLTPTIYKVSTTTLNDKIDILAPSVGVWKLPKFLTENEIAYIQYEATSPTAPFVTGTIGLMFSLNPCLPVDEVESILKMTSWNIDHIKPNKPYLGLYGSGMLNVGKAVEMVYKLYAEGETAYIQDQKFKRWDFKITSYAENVTIRNQEFTENATLNLRSKSSITVGPNTVLRPNSKGSVQLKIDPLLEKECDLVLREGFPE